MDTVFLRVEEHEADHTEGLKLDLTEGLKLNLTHIEILEDPQIGEYGLNLKLMSTNTILPLAHDIG